MAKMSEVTKSRLWLYGLIIGGIAICSLLVNLYNGWFIRQNGVMLMPEKDIAAVSAPQENFAFLAQAAQDRGIFDEETVCDALEKGQCVLARITPDGTDADYVCIIGAKKDAGFLMADETGAQIDAQQVRLYRLYILANP